MGSFAVTFVPTKRWLSTPGLVLRSYFNWGVFYGAPSSTRWKLGRGSSFCKQEGIRARQAGFFLDFAE
jgi:hypothetical protein